MKGFPMHSNKSALKAYKKMGKYSDKDDAVKFGSTEGKSTPGKMKSPMKGKDSSTHSHKDHHKGELKKHFTKKMSDIVKKSQVGEGVPMKSPMKDLKPGIEIDGLPHNTQSEIKNKKESENHQSRKH